MDSSRFRRVERLVAGQFVECKFADLRKLDRFRAFELDGKPVANGAIFTAGNDAHELPDGNFKVSISRYNWETEGEW
jgi:hypothetical protein